MASVAKTPAFGPPGQVPQDPGVDRPEGQAIRAARLVEAALVEEPAHLGGREVRVEHQSGALPDQGQMAGLGQLPAQVGGPAVLPDDGPMEGSTRPSVPGHHGLALVGDADGPRHPTVVGQPTGHLRQGGAHAGPDLGGVVFHPAGSGIVLGQLPVGHVDDLGPVVHDQGSDPGGPGIHGDGHGGAGGHTRTVVTPDRHDGPDGSSLNDRPEGPPSSASCQQSFAILRERPLNRDFAPLVGPDRESIR